jgi:uncharacterized membrane protein
MKNLNWSTLNDGMDKIARLQSAMAGAAMVYSGIKTMKESPKMSIAKSILGGYLIYTALSGDKPMGKLMEKITTKA